MPKTTNPTCKDCRFWHEWTHQAKLTMIFGDCRINEPINFQVADGFITKWPSTRSTDYCGQFEDKHVITPIYNILKHRHD